MSGVAGLQLLVAGQRIQRMQRGTNLHSLLENHLYLLQGIS